MADKGINKTKVIVVTPYVCFFEGKVTSIVLPSQDGEVGVMAGHTPLVVALKPGVCCIRIDDEKKYFTVSEGFAEIGQNVVMIVCNSAEWPADISVKRIADSLNSARETEKECLEIEDAKAREYSLREVRQRMDRVKARVHLLEQHGTDVQIEKLIQYGLK